MKAFLSSAHKTVSWRCGGFSPDEIGNGAPFREGGFASAWCREVSTHEHVPSETQEGFLRILGTT